MKPLRAAKPTTSLEAESEADRLRADLAETLDQLAGNLAPSRLASEVVVAARDRTPGWLMDYWRLARGPVGLGIVGATAARFAIGLIFRGGRR